MSTARDRAALVALLRDRRRPWREYAEAVELAGSALLVLERELHGPQDQVALLPQESAPLLERAERDIAAWRSQGFTLHTVLDDSYPQNLRTVFDRPPLLFVAGRLAPQDARAIAVIGARRASAAGLAAASDLAAGLSAAGYVVVSGLAAGIDSAAHKAALSAGARTIAVIGTGLGHAYPPENARLQKQIAAEGAVVSQFWPEARASRKSFPLRNAVMSGLALGTVVVEASVHSGARLQARLALAHGRPVFLRRVLLDQEWGRELARRPGVHVIDDPCEVVQAVGRLHATDALVE